MSYETEVAAIGARADAQVLALNTELIAAHKQIITLEAQLAGTTPPRPGGKHGIYISGGATGVANFETWLGKPVALVHQYCSAAGNAPSWGSTSYKDKMLLSVDMLSGHTFADVIAGKADAMFTAFGTKLVAAGMGNAIIRLGWEYNGGWMAWSMARAGSAANWKAAFRRVVSALRRAYGQKFRFEWNLAQGKTWDKASYPGPDVVDVHGADTYAGYTSGGVVHYNTPGSRDEWFNGKVASGTSAAIPSWVLFAKSNGKPTAVSEWGPWERDDAAYCTEMLARFKSWGNLEYQVPFNVKGQDGIEHRFPVPYPAFGAIYKAGV